MVELRLNGSVTGNVDENHEDSCATEPPLFDQNNEMSQFLIEFNVLRTIQQVNI